MRSIYNKYKELDKKDKIILYLLGSISINIIFALIKVFLGLITPSIWFLVNGVFYGIISITEVFSVRDYIRIKKEKDPNKKIKIGKINYLSNGILLVLLGISYLIISLIMLNKTSEHIYFNGYFKDYFDRFYLIYLVAFMSFWKLGSAIYGTIKYRRKHDSIIASVKITNYAEALTSIVSTQVALLQAFGEKGINYGQYNGAIGIAVSIIIIFMGVYMISVIKRQKLNNIAN